VRISFVICKFRYDLLMRPANEVSGVRFDRSVAIRGARGNLPARIPDRAAGAYTLKDIVFFPLAILVAALMIGGAMMVGGDAPKCGPVGGAGGPADYRFARVEGANLCRMEGRKGFEVNLNDDILTITAEPKPPLPDYDQNPHFVLAGDLETVYAGQILKVSVTAKPSVGAGAEAFEVLYSTGNAGDSDWPTFQLRPDWQTYDFTFNVPQKLLESAVAFDYLAIRPVPGEKARSLEIKDIEMRRFGAWED
jgi:hypothetical protein